MLLAIRRSGLACRIATTALIALLPIVVRNVLVARQVALVSSQGGLNFYIGNNAAATGQYAALPGIRVRAPLGN